MRQLPNMIILLYPLLFITPFKLFSQEGYRLEGSVVEKESGKPIEQVAVILTEINLWQTTDADGRFVIKDIIPGKHTLYVTCLGYSPIEKNILIEKDSLGCVIKMEVMSLSMEEVVVTAKERELGSASKIEQTAIQHLQPKSVADILQLLPGHITEGISLENPAQVKIREVGYELNGQIITKNTTSALGAAVIVDGAPVSNNSNMQVLSTAKSGTSFEVPSVAGRGVDLREFTTDNIESIEVIRGIPSVEYGDLTSGAVIIKTKAGKTPYEAKISIDPGTKKAFFGKGISLGKNNGSVNTSLDYTISYPDVRLKYEGYKRVTSNLGYSNTFLRQATPLSVNMKLAFFTTIDDEKTDPQLKTKEKVNANNKGVRASLNGKWRLNKKWITNLSYNFSANYSHQHDYYKELQTITAGSMPLATSYEEGMNAAGFIPSEYYSEVTVDGKPFGFFAQVKGNTSVSAGSFFNNIMFGTEWRADGNIGKGRIFDINYPPTINSISTMRPRSYKDIPTLNTLAVFLEDKIKFPIGSTEFTGQTGLRFSNTQPTGLIGTNGALTWEPRVNIKYRLYKNHNNLFFKELSLRFGYGIAAKTPTLIHLYPDKAYFDETSLNYKDETNIDGSLAVLTTKIIEDTSNPDLKPAYNRKKEIGVDFVLGSVKANVTGYYEKQTGGFSFKKIPVYFEHKEYEVEGSGRYPFFIKDEGVYYYDNGQPIQAEYTMDTSFNFYLIPVNDYILIKKGIEYTLDLGKVNAVKTGFVVDGAYMFTERYNTLPTNSEIRSEYQGKPFPYFVVYPAGDKTIRQRFSTSVRSITHIPAVRMILSLTTQIIWFEKEQYLYENEEGEPYVYVTKDKQKIDVDNVYTYRGDGVKKHVPPLGYVDKTGKYYDWDPDTYLTPPFYSMPGTYSSLRFLQEHYPPVVQLNLKLTKEFAENLKVAFTANNFLNIRPYHKLRRKSGYKQLNFPLYFGAELMVKI